MKVKTNLRAGSGGSSSSTSTGQTQTQSQTGKGGVQDVFVIPTVIVTRCTGY